MTDYNVRLNPSRKIKVLTSLTANMPRNFFDLEDVVDANKYNKYVVVYDSNLGKVVLVNPDEVLSAATSEPDSDRTTFTLPQDFENKLDIDLDDRIDVDAGEF